MGKTYECEICLAVNHASKIHCSICGTIPAQYSPIGKPCSMSRADGTQRISGIIRVLVAWGAVRQTSTRTVKRVMRTVPLTYYAEV